MDIYTQLLIFGGLIGLILISAFIWEFIRSVYYWSAGKVLGWSEEEKFEHKTRWLDRAAERERNQQKKDSLAGDNIGRRRTGITLVLAAIIIVLYHLDITWWMSVVVGATAFFGLHMVAGVAIKWWE